MKKVNYIIAVITVLFNYTYSQQNLVPNPSFESYSSCPNNQGQASLAADWFGSGDSPDYFNSCTTFTNFSVPYNWGGYQPAASGNAYCAIGTYLTHTVSANVREYIGTQLNFQLNIGTKYYVSFKTNLSLSNNLQVNCATDKMGALFNTQQQFFLNPIAASYTPQIINNTFITDTLNWTQIFGSFYADSSYNFITIGNFFNDSDTDTLIMNNWNTCTAYYYIDDVCVSTDSIFTKNYQYVGIKENENDNLFLIFPNYTSDFITLSNNSGASSEYKIYDALSRMILNSNVTAFSQKKINLESYPSGIYYLLFEYKNKIITKKIIKL